MDFDDKVLQTVYKAEQNETIRTIWQGGPDPGIGDALKRLAEKGFIKRESVRLEDRKNDGSFETRDRHTWIITDEGRQYLIDKGLVIL